jgi:NAD(P)-dependent dehydrogenase (short-subunit alcohol dehydrogenase family)
VAGSLRAPGCAASGTFSTAVIQLMTVLGRGATGAQAPVRANAICTSWLWTPLVELAWQRMLAGASAALAQGYLAPQSPLARAGGGGGTDRALWCSEDSAYLTGHALVLAGRG